MSFDLDAVKAATAKHGPVCRVVIAEAKGSTPRETGASMLVWPEGQSGTIGGGRLEFEAAAMARQNIDRQIWHSGKAFPLGPGLGQCCGGAVILSFELFTADSLPRSFPHAHPVMAHLSCPPAVTRAMEGDVTQPLYISDWLIEPLTAPTLGLWIWGAGHLGRALVDVLAPLPEISITWVDTSAERFPEDIPNGVTPLPAAKPDLLLPRAPQTAHHLILTYSHDIDLALCHAALSHDFGSCGLIGSATKAARFRRRLGDLGHQDAQISRIICPIGAPELGKHPQAIAIGIATDLIRFGAIGTQITRATTAPQHSDGETDMTKKRFFSARGAS